MKKKRISIRFDDRTLMLLEELSNKTSVKISVVVRSLVMKGINDIVDDAGNLKLDEKPIQEQ
jgi:predicted DNA-binding protein|nr:MAG TPA_asm: KacT, KacA, KacA, Complex, TOXIN [Caudoviricetes sp.]